MVGRYGPSHRDAVDVEPEPADPEDPGLPGRIHTSLTSTPLLLITPEAARPGDASTQDDTKTVSKVTKEIAVQKRAVTDKGMTEKLRESRAALT
ncbi:MAG: hypothetical protein EBR52_02495 [Microbacteriaceae bacterium]|nr:hypothetical protein [Microbacteriaceae bacterium]